MWDHTRQQQLDELQQRAQTGRLTAAERQRLDDLLAAVEEEEAAVLRPAVLRLQQEHDQLQREQARLQAQNAELAVLVEKYADLLARARAQLESLIREREALRVEYERVLR